MDLADVHPVELSLGAAVDASTSYVPRGAGRLGLALHWGRFALWSEAVAQPSFEQDDWKPVTSGLAEPEPKDHRRMDRYTEVRGAGAGGFEFVPARVTFDRRAGTLSIALRGGFGIVHTVDDLVLLQCEGEPDCEATASQWHPDLTAGARLVVEPLPWWAVSLRVDGREWVEVIDSTTLEDQREALFGADFSVRFGWW